MRSLKHRGENEVGVTSLCKRGQSLEVFFCSVLLRRRPTSLLLYSLYVITNIEVHIHDIHAEDVKGCNERISVLK